MVNAIREGINDRDLNPGEFGNTKIVLSMIGLTDEEIDIYFKITGRGPVSTGEIAVILAAAAGDDVTEEYREKAHFIADKLLERGLVRGIPGKTPHYIALPPYTALLAQIGNFKDAVSSIKRDIPIKLDAKLGEIEKDTAKLGKLDEYRRFIGFMKEELPRTVKSSFDKFENELERIRKFREFGKFLMELRSKVPGEIESEFERMNDRLVTIRRRISEAFEKQFRIGALKKMADKIVTNVLKEQFTGIIEYFRTIFMKKTIGILDEITHHLGIVTDTADELGADLGDAYSDIESGLRSTLDELDTRISEVYKDITEGITELKELFEAKIMQTLENDVMEEIIRRLDLSEKTMLEFWERSKKSSMLSFRDVWFVRSAEAMRAQINEALSRVKMRVFIIAPTIDDIDLTPLLALKPYINVRISTYFDPSIPSHKNKLDIINDGNHPNIYIRLYRRKNLWAINKDFEELVLCVVSETEEGSLEIAGMGSILEEHIKLFAPVIEDVWIQSRKQPNVITDIR